MTNVDRRVNERVDAAARSKILAIPRESEITRRGVALCVCRELEASNSKKSLSVPTVSVLAISSVIRFVFPPLYVQSICAFTDTRMKLSKIIQEKEKEEEEEEKKKKQQQQKWKKKEERR